MSDLIGKNLDKYHIVEPLGAGGMAEVYKAAQIGLARYVAIKVIRSQHQTDDDDTLAEIERFEREAIAVAGLSHPNIVPVYDFGRTEDMYYMVMALIEGATLKTEMKERQDDSRPFTLAEIVDIFKALAGATDYAHTQGVIHRDLKPANIMLTPEGQVVLMDFGVARLIKIPGYTTPGVIIGTPAYMSPEQVSGESGDERSDIYALGVILYEMITGRLPFVINKFQDLLKHINETVLSPLALNPETPKGVEWAILKALSKNPDDRFQTAGDLVQALAEYLDSKPQSQLKSHMAARQDWGEAPDVSIFYGRHKELAQLEQWLIVDHCRMIGLLGLGGMGKTTLATKLADQFRDQFDVIIWRSLRNAPSIDDLLDECLQVLSKSVSAEKSDTVEQKISRLIDAFRERRCLLILDNVEAIMQESGQVGHYQSGDEKYGDLLKQAGETQHQSCLMLTSREKPKEFVPLEGEGAPVRSFQVKGLEHMEGQALLEDKRLFATDEMWAALINHYSGNPLALKLISETIREVYDGHVADFLNEEVSIVGDIRDLLDQQFERLSTLEQEIVIWLAIEREPVSRDTLQDNLVDVVSKRDFVQALQSLRRRSLVENIANGFTLQNVILEYITERLIDEVYEEIITESISRLRTHALLKTHTKDYIRESQTRLILQRITEKLVAALDRKEFEDNLERILSALRSDPPSKSDYLAGNILNLLVQLKCDLSAFDFSQLKIRQAYLRDIDLQDVNFAEAELIDAIFTENFGRILSVAISPDGKLLAAGTGNGEVRLWQTATGQPFLTCKGHSNWVQSVAFSPDGRVLASGGTDQTVRLWEVDSGRCLKIISGHSYRVWSVAFSPDGQTLATSGANQTVKLWDAAGSLEQPLKELSGHTDWVRSVAFSPDGRLLASASYDQTVRLWDINTGQCLQTLTGHTAWIWSVAFSPDGRFLASSSDDQTVRLWDAKHEIGDCLHILSGHGDTVHSVAFSPDSRLLASGSNDQTVCLWETNTGQGLYTLSGHTDVVLAVSFSPDGRTLASGSFNQTVRIWEVTHSFGRCLNILRGHTDWVNSVAFSPNSDSLASGGDGGIIRLWKVDGNKCQYHRSLVGHTEWVSSVIFSGDARTLASSSADGTVRLWDIASEVKQNHYILGRHSDPVWSIAFSPDGQTLASGGDDQTVQLWDVPGNTGQSRIMLSGHTGRVRSVAFSPKGEILASGSDDQTIRLWDVNTGQYLHILHEHSDRILAVAFSPDGHLLASGSADHTVRLWDVEVAQCVNTLEGHMGWVRSITFNPVHNILASGSEDHTVCLWDISTGQAIRILSGHEDVVKSMAFSPDGTLLVSASDDGTIKLWEIDTGANLQTLRSDRPYERMNIGGVIGLPEAQKATLKALGAIE